MVGGIVVGLARKADRTILNVQDERAAADYCCQDVIEVRRDTGEPVAIGLGDSIWWQSRDAMWTPKGSARERCGVDFDIRLPRVGYSYGFNHFG